MAILVLLNVLRFFGGILRFFLFEILFLICFFVFGGLIFLLFVFGGLVLFLVGWELFDLNSFAVILDELWFFCWGFGRWGGWGLFVVDNFEDAFLLGFGFFFLIGFDDGLDDLGVFDFDELFFFVFEFVEFSVPLFTHIISKSLLNQSARS